MIDTKQIRMESEGAASWYGNCDVYGRERGGEETSTYCERGEKKKQGVLLCEDHGEILERVRKLFDFLY